MQKSESSCPRCAAPPGQCVLQHTGWEEGRVVWQVFHCDRCWFTWRSTEPARTLDPALRAPWAQMRDLDPGHFRSAVPPARAVLASPDSPQQSDPTSGGLSKWS